MAHNTKVIERIPNWLFLDTIVVLLSILLLIILFGWLVKYPEKIVTEVVISSVNPPLDIVSKKEGQLHLFVSNQEKVEKGRRLAFIGSLDVLKGVEVLEEKLKKVGDSIDYSTLAIDISDFYDVAFLRAELFDLNINFSNLKRIKKSFEHLAERDAIVEEIRSLEVVNSELHRLQSLLKEELQIARLTFHTDSILYSKNSSTIDEFTRAKLQLLQSSRNQTNNQILIHSNEHEIKRLKGSLRVFDEDLMAKYLLATEACKKSINSTLKKVIDWRSHSILKADMKCDVHFSHNIKLDRYVQPGEHLFSLILNDTTSGFDLQLPPTAVGKIRIGQRVLIEVDSYPVNEFGRLEGSIMRISRIPENNKYWVGVAVNGDYLTTMGKRIKLNPNMSGSAMVYISEQHLIRQLISLI